MPQINQHAYKKIQLPFKIKQSVLALGSQGNNTVCFAKGRSAYLSRVHPDLNNPEDFSDFAKEVEYLLKEHPKIIACDLHPDYQSSKYAHQLRTTNCQLRTIQHHHAHIASCMLDNGLSNQRVIGVAFDGTGLGSDGTLWGAEFLLCDYRNFSRRAHLKAVPLLGGRQAILQPWRVAAAWLTQSGVRFPGGIDRKKWRVLKACLSAGINSPFASSMGRLFDAAASLILPKYKTASAASLPVQLERLACHYQGRARGYKFKIIKTKNGYIIDPAQMWRQITADLKRRGSKERIAYRFHLTVAEMVKNTCCALRKESGIKKVVFSGGVFQNSLLLNLSLDLLYKQGFWPFVHRQLPCSDAALSAGEAAIAGYRS